MVFKTFTLLIFILTLLGSQSAYSQTCRVCSGKSESGSMVYTEVFEYDYVDVKPEFPGGGRSMINFINANRQYPQDAYEQGIEGRVTCSFVVNPDGKISHIQVLRGVETSLNCEAMRIIGKMPEWKPGVLNGVPVPVRVVCCIPFRK